MDTKSILNARKKLNELASQHNKLTTLVACLLNEINSVKKELSDLKSGDMQSNGMNSSQYSMQQMPNNMQPVMQQMQQMQQMQPVMQSNMQSNMQPIMQSNMQRVSSSQVPPKTNNKFTNFSDLRAEEILQQLSINNTSGSSSIDN
jgi:alanyl-tRNA synthetase